ncbi:MAG: hypothetical protein GY854_00395 [Deltaproteobacteria bacterium]|nr:hypothetical protein [Deltaproteobacteria bacterium]
MTPHAMSVCLLLSFAMTTAVCGAEVKARADDSSVQDTFSGDTFSRLSQEEKALLQEYCGCFLKLKAFYDNVTIEAHEELLIRPRSKDGIFAPTANADLVLARVRDYTFRADGSGDRYRMDGTDYDATDPTKAIEAKIGLMNPDGQYVFQRNPTTGKYYLRLFGKNKAEGLVQLSAYVFPAAPFTFLATPLDEYVLQDQPGVIIDKVELQHDSGEELVEIARSYRQEDRWSECVLRFYRERSWALKDIQFEGAIWARGKVIEDRQSAKIQTCFYDGEQDGIPLLKSCSIECSARDVASNALKTTRRQDFEIRSLTPGPPAQSLFDDEVILGNKKVGELVALSWPRAAIIIVSVLLVIVGIYLKRQYASEAA